MDGISIFSHAQFTVRTSRALAHGHFRPGVCRRIIMVQRAQVLSDVEPLAIRSGENLPPAADR